MPDIQEFIKGCTRAGGTIKTANTGEKTIISEPHTRDWEEETQRIADQIDNEIKNVIVCEGIDPANQKTIAAVPNPKEKGDILTAEIRTPTGKERLQSPNIDGSNPSDDITIHSYEKTIGFRNGQREETKPMMTEIDQEVSAEIMEMEDGEKAAQKMRKQTEEALAEMDEDFKQEKTKKEFMTRRANFELDRNGRGQIL